MEGNQRFLFMQPFKSVAVAILLALFLGPIGLLYSTFWGGVIMFFISFILLAAMTVNSAIAPLVLIAWIICSFWTVRACNRYNKNLMKTIHKKSEALHE